MSWHIFLTKSVLLIMLTNECQLNISADWELWKEEFQLMIMTADFWKIVQDHKILDWLSESEYLILILSHSDMKSEWDEIRPGMRQNEIRSLWNEMRWDRILMRWDKMRQNLHEIRWDQNSDLLSLTCYQRALSML